MGCSGGGSSANCEILRERGVDAETFRLFKSTWKKANKSCRMENLFEMSFTMKLQETFYNSWAAADDRALTLTGVAQR